MLKCLMVERLGEGLENKAVYQARMDLMHAVALRGMLAGLSNELEFVRTTRAQADELERSAKLVLGIQD